MNTFQTTMRMFDLILDGGPVEEHRCPECGDTFGCWDEPCGAPESALCEDCNHGVVREHRLACGHLPGGCRRYLVGGKIVCAGGAV